jgi:PAS domain-containing protein
MYACVGGIVQNSPMKKPILNLDEVEFDDIEDNGLFTSRRAQISDHIGARKLGYNLTVLPPGKAQCPFHNHYGEEEMFFIVRGAGRLEDAQRQLSARSHLLQATLETLQDPIFVLDAEGVVVACVFEEMEPELTRISLLNQIITSQLPPRQLPKLANTSSVSW